MNTGYYNAEDAIWHAYSPLLMREILRLFDKETQIIDLGCGLNNYISIANSLGYNGFGLDNLNLGSEKFVKTDLSDKINVGTLAWMPYDDFSGGVFIIGKEKSNVISFEVGEHIPSKYEDIFIDNLCIFGGDILMSWAVPGQAGIGHINCRSNEWVIDKMSQRGYALNMRETNLIRKNLENCHCSWFKNTIMFFQKK